MARAARRSLQQSIRVRMEVHGIKVLNGDPSCTAEGACEILDRRGLLTKIDVHYTIRSPDGAIGSKVDGVQSAPHRSGRRAVAGSTRLGVPSAIGASWIAYRSVC